MVARIMYAPSTSYDRDRPWDVEVVRLHAGPDVLEIAGTAASLEEAKKAVHERLHPHGTGVNWEVERFEPPLPTTSEDIARHLIKRLQDDVMLGKA